MMVRTIKADPPIETLLRGNIVVRLLRGNIVVLDGVLIGEQTLTLIPIDR